jgi:hypothetical protein
MALALRRFHIRRIHFVAFAHLAITISPIRASKPHALISNPFKCYLQDPYPQSSNCLPKSFVFSNGCLIFQALSYKLPVLHEPDRIMVAKD